MLTKDTKAAPDPNVVLTKLQNGETVLLHLGTQTYFTLNETGTKIWQLMSEGSTLGEIAQTLQDQYDVNPDQARQSVFDLTAVLADAKLVSMDRDPLSPGLKSRTGP